MSFVLPPALALGEDRRASGRDVLTAVIAGADTGVRVALAVDMTGLNRYGAHPTGALGQFGSAAAAAKVLGFGPEEVAGTLGLAGSAALGTEIIKSEGSHLKRLYAGRASRAGVECALLTERGFAGPRRVFETPYGGVFSVLWAGTPAPGYDFGRLTAGLGRDFGELLRVGVKPYPMHQHTHAALDCARALVRSGAFRFEEVERVVVRCRTRSTRVLNHPEPATVMNAQQSLPYGVAVMLRDGELTVRQVSEERVRDPEVRRFARERIALVPLPEADEAFPEKDPAEVEVRTKSGAVFRHREEVGGGQPGRPMPPEEIREKFRANAAPVLGPDRAERVIAAVERLEELPDAGELTALLRPEE